MGLNQVNIKMVFLRFNDSLTRGYKGGFDTLTTGFFSTITFSSLMIGGSSTSMQLGHNPVSISILQPDGARQICFARIEKGMNRIISESKIFIFSSNQTLILLASSKALLSLTPRYAEVAVTEDCPSNLLTASTLCVLS